MSLAARTASPVVEMFRQAALSRSVFLNATESIRTCEAFLDIQGDLICDPPVAEKALLARFSAKPL